MNGNNELLEAEKAGQEAAASAAPPPSKQADGGPASPGVVLRKKPVCAAAKQPAARASMSSIIKGSVMDKVTTVFNNGVTMGNANNSANKKAAELPTAQSSGPDLPISPVANVTTEAEKSGGGEDLGGGGARGRVQGAQGGRGGQARGRGEGGRAEEGEGDLEILRSLCIC